MKSYDVLRFRGDRRNKNVKKCGILEHKYLSWEDNYGSDRVTHEKPDI